MSQNADDLLSTEMRPMMRKVVKCLFQYLADDALFILRLLNCVVVIRFLKAVMKCLDCVSATA